MRKSTPALARRITALLAAAGLAAAGLTACGSGGGSGSGSGGKVKLGMVTQLSVQPYFVTEADGAKAEAKKLGVDLQVVDFGMDSGKVISQTKTLITSGVQGIAVVPANTDVGPRLAAMTKQHDVSLVASDSPLKDSSGASLPFVGLDNKQSGVQVGQIAARIYGQLKWPAADTYFADVEAPMQACLQRTNAEYQVFRQAHPDVPASHVVKVPYDGLANKASDSMRATITAHPQAKHWVIASCNDAGVVGALRALRDKNFPVANALGVGLGGDQACQAYTQAYIKDGLRASTYLNPKKIGEGDVKVLYEMVVKHKTPPQHTYVPTPEINAKNYKTIMPC